MPQSNIEKTFQGAIAHHQAGRLPQAESLYRQILAQKPRHAGALHYLGVIAHQQGRNQVAADLIGQAIAIEPDNAEAYGNLGNALMEIGRLDEAIMACRQAVRLKPRLPAAYTNLGNALKSKGQLDEAVAVHRHAISLKPDSPEAHNNLGSVLLEQNQLAEAIAAYRRAISLQPRYAKAHYNLGAALQKTGQLDEAIAAYRAAIALNPNSAESWNDLGNALRETGQRDQAVAAYRQAITLRPDAAQVFNNLGNVLREMGQLDPAIAACRQAIALNPKFAGAFLNLGNALEDNHQLDEAIAAFGHAIVLNPNLADAFINLGNALGHNDQLDEAVAAFARAVAINPNLAEGYNNLGNALKAQGRLDDAVTAYRQALALKPGFTIAHSSLVFVIHYHPGYDARAIAAEHNDWNRQHAQPLQHLIAPHANDRDPDRRLRIGYISADFRDHPAARFLLPLLANHDKRQVEVFAYSNLAEPDAITQQLRSCVDAWRDIAWLSDDQLADLIRQDRIDILVDLSMHSGHNRLLVFARKPAPVQVSYLAYCASTGLQTIDYRLSDPFMDPVGMDESIYSERTIRLPETYWCYQPYTGTPPVGPLPAQQRGNITFGCLNNFCKVSDSTLLTWAQLLRAVPNSGLLLHAKSGSQRQRVADLLEREGIDPARIKFAGHLPLNDYLALYGQIDIALDTFPFGGGTTSCDALWMGVPVVSLAGKTAVGRGGLSILSNLGLAELAADSPESYIRIASELARDLPRLNNLRSTLRQRMLESPLMDAKRFASNVEMAFREMWNNWVQGPAQRASDAPAAPQQAPPSPQMNAAVLHLSGRLAYEAKRYDQAVDQIGRAIAIAPTASFYLDQGLALWGQGRRDAAVAAVQSALALDPNSAVAAHTLGGFYFLQGQWQQAAANYERAVKLKPKWARARHDLGVALWNLGHLDEAVDGFHQVLSQQPSHSQAANNLARVLAQQQKWDEALAVGRGAIARDPQFAPAYDTLALIQKQRGNFDEAIAASRQAIGLDPNYAEAHANLALLLRSVGAMDEAFDVSRRAVELAPNNPAVLINLATLLAEAGLIEDALIYTSRAIAATPADAYADSTRLFLLHYQSGLDPQAIFTEHLRWNQLHAMPLAKAIPAHDNDPSPQRRLRIGYVSPDFREHSVAFFLEGLLAHHDPSAVEIFCYSNVSRPDATTARLKQLPAVWRDIVALNDEQAAQMIRQDRIDVLVDLAGHSSANRMLLFARKPAPLQVTYLGYPDTTGLSSIDYRITDGQADPPGQSDALNSEKLLRLPRIFLCYRSDESGPAVAALPALANGFITFGSFNALPKINAELVRLWAAILRDVPGSRLLLKNHGLASSSAQRRIHQLFQADGIEPDRIMLSGKVAARSDHLALYNQIDLALDTYPYHGTTTTCEAIWMGVPVIVLAGAVHMSRVGVSLLHAVGLDDLAAQNPGQYVQTAVNLARDIDRLGALRAGLRARLAASPLMDAAGFAKDMEMAYRQIWLTWGSRK
jgi:protein O-GlcNAc transferase